jgi:hypothetical protein
LRRSSCEGSSTKKARLVSVRAGFNFYHLAGIALLPIREHEQFVICVQAFRANRGLIMDT